MSLAFFSKRAFAVLLSCGALFSVLAATNAHANPSVLFGPSEFGPAIKDVNGIASAFSPDGKVFYVLEQTRVLAIDLNSKDLTPTVILESEFNLGESQSSLVDPSAIAVAPDGKTLYVVDTGGHCVLSVDLTSGKAKIFFGKEDGLKRTTALAEEKDSEEGSDLTQLEDPRDIVITRDGLHIYIGGNDQVNSPDMPARGRVVVVDTELGTVDLFAGNGLEVPSNDSLDLKSASDIGFGYVSSVAVSPDGATVYVVDEQYNRVVAVDVASGRVHGFAGASMSLEAPGYKSDWTKDDNGPAPGEVYLNSPSHVSVAPNGLVYVLDRGYSRLFEMDPVNNTTHLIAGSRPEWCEYEDEPKHELRFGLGKFTVAPDGSLLVRDGETVILIGANDEFETVLEELWKAAKNGESQRSLQSLKLLAIPASSAVRQVCKTASGLDRADRVCPDGKINTECVGRLVVHGVPIDAGVVKLIGEWANAANAPGNVSAQPIKRLRARLVANELKS